jgi:hypothetical protein
MNKTLNINILVNYIIFIMLRININPVNDTDFIYFYKKYFVGSLWDHRHAAK